MAYHQRMEVVAMSTLAVECRNKDCSAAFALPHWNRGGIQTFNDQTKATQALRDIERREMLVGLHNALQDPHEEGFPTMSDGVPQELLARSFAATCPHCSRTYLYSSRDAFLTLETDLPEGRRA